MLTSETPVEQHAHETRTDLSSLGEASRERPCCSERLRLCARRAGSLRVRHGSEVEVDRLDEERFGGAQVGQHAGSSDRNAGHGRVWVVERRELVRPRRWEGNGEEDLGGVVAVDARVRQEGYSAL